MNRLEHGLADSRDDIKEAQLVKDTHNLRPYENTVSWLRGNLSSLLNKQVVDTGSLERVCKHQANRPGAYNYNLEPHSGVLFVWIRIQKGVDK